MMDDVFSDLPPPPPDIPPETPDDTAPETLTDSFNDASADSGQDMLVFDSDAEFAACIDANLAEIEEAADQSQEASENLTDSFNDAVGDDRNASAQDTGGDLPPEPVPEAGLSAEFNEAARSDTDEPEEGDDTDGVEEANLEHERKDWNPPPHLRFQP